MAPLIKRLANHTPARRLGAESEVSAAIVFLLSPPAAFISGSCFRVDGAAPNAKRVWPEVGSGISSPAFNGFHLSKMPQVYRDGRLASIGGGADQVMLGIICEHMGILPRK